MADSTELAAARTAADKAVREFVTVHAKEHGRENAYVTGWATFAEYVTSEFVREEMSATVVLVPDDQHAATSRGLFEFGSDAFKR